MLAPFLGVQVRIQRHGEPEYAATAIPLQGDNLDQPRFTGRHLITLPEDRQSYRNAIDVLSKSPGMRIALSSEFQHTAYTEEDIKDADMFINEDIGVALTSVLPEEARRLTQSFPVQAVTIEPELVMYTIPLTARKKKPCCRRPSLQNPALGVFLRPDPIAADIPAVG